MDILHLFEPKMEADSRWEIEDLELLVKISSMNALFKRPRWQWLVMISSSYLDYLESFSLNLYKLC